MSTVVADCPGIFPSMSKSKKPPTPESKPTGGRHKTVRINVGMPEDWHAIARKIAAKRQQPVVYTLIALLAREAEQLGIRDIPQTPWEDDDE